MNDTIKTIHSLRSIHGDFSDTSISDADLDIIVNASVHAANASARQSYSIIVIKNKNKIKQLSEYSGDKMLVFCVDFSRIIALADHLGHNYETNGIIDFITGSTDAVLAAQTACIAAKSLKIDSLFTQRGLHRRNIPKVFEMLNLPKQHCFPLLMLVLGYPKKESVAQKGRLSGKGIVYYETHQPLSSEEMDELVSAYDDKNKNLGLIENWDKQTGIHHYLDWFYTKWCRPINVEAVISSLKKAGFLKS